MPVWMMLGIMALLTAYWVWPGIDVQRIPERQFRAAGTGKFIRKIIVVYLLPIAGRNHLARHARTLEPSRGPSATPPRGGQLTPRPVVLPLIARGGASRPARRQPAPLRILDDAPNQCQGAPRAWIRFDEWRR